MIDALTTQRSSGSLERGLLAAQSEAQKLFESIQKQGLLRPGRTEKEVSKDIFDLAARSMGTRTFWHKRIVRSGPNTRCTYRVNPPDRMLEEDDIAFVDLGPVFENMEADFGRTYVLGDASEKHAIVEALPTIFEHCKSYYLQNPGLTGSQFYAYIVEYCQSQQWDYGGPYAGHLVGEFPHEKQLGEDVENYIDPANHQPMNALDRFGNKRHWILEIHLLSRVGDFGGFYEELLTL